MKVLIAFILGITCIFSSSSGSGSSSEEGRKPKVWITNYMPEDTGVPDNATDNLGICFGSNTQWSTYSYAAALRYTSGSACCSASIISLNPAVLLTAAHCNGCTGQVRIGCNNPNNCDGDSYPIQQFIQNPNYGGNLQFSSDIAVMRLTNPITTSGAVAATVPNTQPTIGTIRATGYGITQTGSIPTVLQTASFNEIENTECQSIMSSALGGGSYIDGSMICIRGGSAGQENVPSTCSGDSGGPWNQMSSLNEYGVTSWGLQGSGTGCNSCNCCTGYPGVGANVAYAAQWINGYLSDWDAAYERDQNLTRALRMQKKMQ
eukprot:402005_1